MHGGGETVVTTQRMESWTWKVLLLLLLLTLEPLEMSSSLNLEQAKNAQWLR